jgi:hypothetical protein
MAATRRLIRLLVLIAGLVVMSLAVSSAGHATGCGWDYFVVYYSDASKTTQVGYWERDCSGHVTLIGSETPYYDSGAGECPC